MVCIRRARKNKAHSRVNNLAICVIAIISTTRIASSLPSPLFASLATPKYVFSSPEIYTLFCSAFANYSCVHVLVTSGHFLSTASKCKVPVIIVTEMSAGTSCHGLFVMVEEWGAKEMRRALAEAKLTWRHRVLAVVATITERNETDSHQQELFSRLGPVLTVSQKSLGEGHRGAPVFLAELGDADALAAVMSNGGGAARGVFRTTSPLELGRVFRPIAGETFNVPMLSQESSAETVLIKRWPDLTHRQLIISTFDCPPFSYVDQGPPDGIEMQVLLDAARRFNFRWRVEQPNEHNRYGRWIKENSTWNGGMNGAVTFRKAHLAFCTMFLVQKKVMTQDMSVPWGQNCYTFLAPRPLLLPPSWRSALRPLEGPLWAALGLSMLLGATVLALTASAVGHLHRIPPPLGLSSFWLSLKTKLGILLATSFPKLSTRDTALRQLVSSWSFFGLLMVTVYSSSLVSHLTVPLYGAPIDTVADMVRLGLHWGINYELPLLDIFNYQKPAHKAFAERLQPEKSATEREARVAAGAYAVVGPRIASRFFVEGFPLPLHRLSALRSLRECVARFYLSFALPKHSPLTPLWDALILRMQAAGLPDMWASAVFRRRAAAQSNDGFEDNDEDEDDDDDGPEVLTLKHLQGTFFLLLLGLFLATVTFITECRRRFCKGFRHGGSRK